MRLREIITHLRQELGIKVFPLLKKIYLAQSWCDEHQARFIDMTLTSHVFVTNKFSTMSAATWT